MSWFFGRTAASPISVPIPAKIGSNQSTPENEPQRKRQRLNEVNPYSPLRVFNQLWSSMPSPRWWNKHEDILIQNQAVADNEENRVFPDIAPNVEAQEEERSNQGTPRRRRARSPPPVRTHNISQPGPSGTRSIAIPRRRTTTTAQPQRTLIVPEDILFHKHSTNLPASCLEAIAGNESGSMRITPALRGIASRKFSSDDVHASFDGDDWPLQAIMQYGNACKALFEGWSPETMETQSIEDLRETAPELLQEMLHRSKFLKFLEKEKEKQYSNLSESEKRRIKKNEYCYQPLNLEELMLNPEAAFWILEDLAFFQSRILTEAGMKPIFYVECNAEKRKAPGKLSYFPNFYMVTTNLCTSGVVDRLKERLFSRHIDDLRVNHARKINSNIQRSRVCASPACVCNDRYDILFSRSNAIQLLYNEEGRLVLNNFKTGKNHMVIECSDACGCDSTCINRQLQRGTQKVLAVVSEAKKGFGLRALENIEKGEFIIAYDGKLMGSKENDGDTSYEIEFRTFGNFCIDAKDYGNAARFPNHSCQPNMAFVEVFTRTEENHLLVPRIGLYALRDIPKTEELTVRYYHQRKPSKKQDQPQRNRTACQCKSKKCMKWLP